MGWLSALSNAWNSMTIFDALGTPTPGVNIDGTPMLNESMDINGNPLGVSSIDTPTSHSWGWDSNESGNSGGGGFSDWP